MTRQGCVGFAGLKRQLCGKPVDKLLAMMAKRVDGLTTPAVPRDWSPWPTRPASLPAPTGLCILDMPIRPSSQPMKPLRAAVRFCCGSRTLTVRVPGLNWRMNFAAIWNGSVWNGAKCPRNRRGLIVIAKPLSGWRRPGWPIAAPPSGATLPVCRCARAPMACPIPARRVSWARHLRAMNPTRFASMLIGRWRVLVNACGLMRAPGLLSLIRANLAMWCWCARICLQATIWPQRLMTRLMG